LIQETSPTFINYSGYRYRYDISGGAEIVWSSELDGYNHLYRISGKSGLVLNQITKGEWMVRNVLFVNEEKQQITFEGSGKEPGQDPYFIHVYRVNFDGTGLIRLTEGNGNHSASFSPDKSYLVDTWSRVDQPAISVLRKSSDGSVALELEKADITKLLATGWKPPVVFTAKGRDGKTDIWGVIIRPINFDPNKKYPVIENIYAGPQGFFVPKTFSTQTGMQAYAELGFVVVQIDGMGTADRSKAFHDVCWRNLGDAGFPDRILWMQAAAKENPYMDITRVGIYGTSAGGQSATGAVLFHPEFYKVAVSSCGCQDNRMDKIWWNEQWMGYPVGEWYEASSNVVNATKLKGKLLLIVGEMDHNVDPSSTMQLVNALIKANKDFDLLVVPGMDHSGGGPMGDRKRMDFFVKNLLGVNPPDWNK
jgi:dipeptidyl aminopeptidase/acylaminoacyl peptidase